MRFLPTVRAAGVPTPTKPSDIINFAGFNLAIPTSRSVAATGVGVTPAYPAYAGGELKYSNATPRAIQESNATTITTIGDYQSPWFYVQQAPDGIWEVVFTCPIWGSPSTPFGGGGTSDHTRSELRQILPGPTNSGASLGDFKIADRLRATMLCRPLRFPDVDNAGSPTAANNLTMMQLHPISDGASSSVFSILALRKDGKLQATMRDANGTNGAATDAAQNLLIGVSLGDLLWIELTTEADRLEWRAENRTKGGGIKTLSQPVTAGNLSGGLNQRDRFQYLKGGCYQGTEVLMSTDAAKAVNGVLSLSDVIDRAAVALRQFQYGFL